MKSKILSIMPIVKFLISISTMAAYKQVEVNV